MSKPIHVAWDYQASTIVMQQTFGKKIAGTAATRTTKTLCGATKQTADTRGLDGLCDVTCISCLQVVAKEGRARTAGGMQRRMKARVKVVRNS